VTTDSEDTPRALSSIDNGDTEVGMPMKSVVKPKGRMPPPKDIAMSSRVVVPYPFLMANVSLFERQSCLCPDVCHSENNYLR
jgi:hypothetical protein